jgi:tetratricopeptide (TPR) repeat protein
MVAVQISIKELRMKITTKYLVLLSIIAAGILGAVSIGHAQLASGQGAPVFSLKDTAGRFFDLSQMKDRTLIIIYFFDVDSRPSQEGLLTLNQIAEEHKYSDLTVLAITHSSREKIDRFTDRSNLTFPVILDSSNVSTLYGAKIVLPTVCVVGPDLKVLDYFQGGGKATEIMLVRLAERELQRRRMDLAEALSEEAIARNPENFEAKTVKGYAALKGGNTKKAKKVFQELSRTGGQTGIVGNEGLAAVYVKEGRTEEALELAKEVERKAPQRSYANVLKGDLFYSQGKIKEAKTEYQKASEKKGGEIYHKALGHNQLGRMYADAGQYTKARDSYDQAVAIDPFWVEGTTNKGRTFEKEGKWDKALESYRKGLRLDKKDTFAAVLAKRAQQMLELQKNTERKKRIDRLVKDLAARFRSQEEEISPEGEDSWTSRPMILSFTDFQEKGGLSERDGFSAVLIAHLTDSLNASGRVQVVERALVERLLEELNLGSSELADPATTLKLGRILAAKLVGTGSLYHLPEGTLMSFRIIDTETSAIPKVLNKQFSSQVSLEKELYLLNRDILHTIISRYPLRGFVVQASGNQVIINLGSKNGVVLGTKFEILEEQEPINYKGKKLQKKPKSVAEIEITQVEPDLCYAKILKRQRAINSDDKVQEKIE